MLDTTYFADVILPLALPQLYTYEIPAHVLSECKPGKRAVVQFGKKKIYSALIRSMHTSKPEMYDTKEIISILDDEPVIHEIQFKFWDWLADYYLCTTGEVMKAALPAGLKLESETNIIFNPLFNESYGNNNDLELSQKEEMILNTIRLKKVMTLQEISGLTEQKNNLNVIKDLIDKKAIYLEEKIKEAYKPKFETFVTLHNSISTEDELHSTLNQLEKAPQQLKLFMGFLHLTDYLNNHTEGASTKKTDLLKHADCSDSVLKALQLKNILTIHKLEVGRLGTYGFKPKRPNDLNEFQRVAFESIKEFFLTKKVVLLHGVTSSGKTEIYIHLIREYIALGKQVLYLLPEIALTSQIITRLISIFGDKIGIYHSKFNDSERVEIWQSVLNKPKQETQEKKKDTNGNSYQIILGVRSAIFLPYDNLGLIIIDEEHENTYKQQDPAPRYHARDAAIMLAHFHNAHILMGTATPSIETYFNTKTGKYGCVELMQRFQDMQLPEIMVVNIAEAHKQKKMKSHFSVQLLTTIKTALEKKEQVILFQNRRGFSLFIECKICGWIPHCKNCNVSLTYHKTTNHLNCHYCGYTIGIPAKCEACGDVALETKGFGTEKIEDEIAIFFPESKIARLDLDSTRSKHAYQRIITDFENRNLDILIGTQMVTKGLDFDNVSLVGILNADNLLNFPDFRAFERSYQLMAQVGGRAGRKNKRGLVVIQTRQPEHQIIQFVIGNDYKSLYSYELINRKKFHYPPFYRLIELTLKHKNVDILEEGAQILADELRNVFGQRILGPEFPIINRIHNFFLKIILIKIEKESSVSQAKGLLKQVLTKFKTNPPYKSIFVGIDVDPF
jgi:primosomal protein N' (replication factor Y)